MIFFDRTTLGYNLNDIVKNYYEFNYLKKVLESKAKKNLIMKSKRINKILIGTSWLFDQKPR